MKKVAKRKNGFSQVEQAVIDLNNFVHAQNSRDYLHDIDVKRDYFAMGVCVGIMLAAVVIIGSRRFEG